eukprot:m51a1_g12955 hypothetical protein (274) ;mRNA; r:1422-2243
MWWAKYTFAGSVMLHSWHPVRGVYGGYSIGYGMYGDTAPSVTLVNSKLWLGGSTLWVTDSRKPYNDGQWHHYAWTIDRLNTLTRFYIDGSEAMSYGSAYGSWGSGQRGNISTLNDQNWSGSCEVTIGNCACNNECPSFIGSLDDLMMFHEVLPLDTIQQAAAGRWQPDDAGTTTVALTPGSGLKNFGYDYGTLSATKTGRIVVLQGLLDGVTGSGTLTTLPQGFCPSQRLVFVVDTAAGPARVDVLPSGVVHLEYIQNSWWVSICGITFIAGP